MEIDGVADLGLSGDIAGNSQLAADLGSGIGLGAASPPLPPQAARLRIITRARSIESIFFIEKDAFVVKFFLTVIKMGAKRAGFRLPSGVIVP